MRWALLALIGCASEPSPWHGPVRLDEVTRSEGTCEPGEGAVVEPFEPYLFIAVVDGEPPLSSLYACPSADGCPPGPFLSFDVDRLTPARLVGGTSDVARSGQTCTVTWDGVEATREGERVTLVWRRYEGETDAASDAECLEVLEAVQGEDCDEVLIFTGARAR